MPAFEYLLYVSSTYKDACVIVGPGIRKDVGSQSRVEVMNELGRAGWELTTGSPIPEGYVRECEYWFRRQIPAE